MSTGCEGRRPRRSQVEYHRPMTCRITATLRQGNAYLRGLRPQRRESLMFLILAVIGALAPVTLRADEDASIEDLVDACQRPPQVYRHTPLGKSQLCREWSMPPEEWRPYFFEYATLEDVTRCLEEGADPNATTESGEWTPLHGVAGYNGTPAIISALLAAGADPNARDSCDRTPLHYAAITGLDNVIGQPPKSGHIEGMISVLIEGGSDPDARDCREVTPLHEASSGADHVTISTLLRNGANPHSPDNDGNTPLHYAVGALYRSSDELRTVRDAIAALLKSGADPNARNHEAETPLHSAARTILDKSHVVAALLVAGADPNARTLTGRTPLHVAAQLDSAATVAALLSGGADPDSRDITGGTPLHVVASNSRPALGPRELDDFQIAAVVGDRIGVIEELIDHGADPNAASDIGTPLHMAALRNASPAVVSALVQAGANPNARSSLFLERTPLHLASQVAIVSSMIVTLIESSCPVMPV